MSRSLRTCRDTGPCVFRPARLIEPSNGSTDDPLAGLDEVPWESLYHAYGPAVDVPEQLRALRSTEVPVRHRALSQLFGNLYHQGTRWGASCHVVPFLVALTDDPDTPDRAAVADLLRSVVLGDRRDDELPFDPRRTFAAAEGITDEQAALVERHLQAEDLFEHGRGTG